MALRAIIAGIVLWLMGTAMFRFIPGTLIHAPTLGRTIPAYLLYFVVTIVIVRVLLGGLGLRRESWPTAVTLIILPTLFIDAFTTAFFPTVFPNLPEAAAPTFGGMMLIVCAGAVVASWIRPRA